MRRGDRKLVEAAVERLKALGRGKPSLEELAGGLKRIAEDLKQHRVGAKDWSPKDWNRK